MSPSTYGQRMTTFGYQKTGYGSTCPFRKEMAYLLLWEGRSKGAWQCTAVREYGKLKAAESQRSVSEFVPASWSLTNIVCPIALQERSGTYLITQQRGKRRWCVCLGSKRFIQTDSHFLFLMKISRVLTGHPWHTFPLQTVEVGLQTKNKLACDLFLHRLQAHSCTARIKTCLPKTLNTTMCITLQHTCHSLE